MKHYWEYLKKEIWRVDLESLPKWKASWIRFMRITILISQGFSKSQIQQGASTLTYYTLLGIVPIIALLIGIARGFNFENALKNWLLRQLPEQKDVIDKIFTFANASLEHVHQGIIAGIGVLILLWAGIKIFLYLERALNTIWEVKQGRSFARRFTDYLAMLVLCPLIVLLASGITIYLSTALTALTSSGILKHVGPFLIPMLNLIPFLLTCLLLTFLYIFMPNTHVYFFPALWAGIITGIMYQIVQWVYLYFQIGVTSYNAIYGTFAALPLFLIWVHLSWVIVLLGAKISFALQNVNAFDFISEDVQLSHRIRMVLSLRVAQYCIKRFCEGQPAASAITISNKLSIPLLLVGQLLYQLVSVGVLSEIKQDRDQDEGFQPARNVDQLTIKRVIDMMNLEGGEISLPPSAEIDLILKSLEKFDQAIEESDGNILLKDV